MKKQEIIDKYGIEEYERRIEKQRQYRQNHKEDIKQYYQDHKEERKQYYQSHREEAIERQKQYRQNHKEELNEKSKQYQREHKEQKTEYYKQYRDNHREELAEYKKQHNKRYLKTLRGRAIRLVGNYTRADKNKGRECDLTPEWIIENIFSSKCYYCEETDWTKLGTDRIDNTKGHTKDNCICCCRECNTERNNRYSVEEFKRYKQMKPKDHIIT